LREGKKSYQRKIEDLAAIMAQKFCNLEARKNLELKEVAQKYIKLVFVLEAEFDRELEKIKKEEIAQCQTNQSTEMTS